VSSIRVRTDVQSRLSRRRTGEIVAEELRRQIVDGELADGELLPGQMHLVERFQVSLVSLREGLRILESEGLVSIRRGNRGGAVVHAPAETSAAYMLGLVLQSNSVRLDDLEAALRELEPSCAALAAARPDRAKTIVRELNKINDSTAGNLSDGAQFMELGLEFHHAIVRGCGNLTMVTVMGSLEALQHNSEQEWLDYAHAKSIYPSMPERRATLNAHIKLTEAIERGDEQGARRVAARHLPHSQAVHRLQPEEDRRVRALSPQEMKRLKQRP
jgi:GntR family transcriptional regulator, transcriptional repressor for pyruvate dehydrogenase complex